jgi:dolichol-phosphate mannosyltransferase
MPKFSLAIPLYNEEECVEKSVTEIIRGLDRNFAGEYELILVINGSRDRTPEICQQLAGYYSCVRTVRLEPNQGYGGGIIGGLEAARGDYVGFMCGDGQISPDDLGRVMQEIASGSWDLVKACRISRGDGWIRKANSLVYNSLFALLLGTRSRDINAMPKIWRREAAWLLAPTSRDWFIDAEIMVKARYRGLRVKEVDVRYLERAGGRSVVRVATIFEFLRNAAAAMLSGRLRAWKRRPEAPLRVDPAR